MLRLEVVTDPARLDELAPEWNALADRMGQALLRHEWFSESARVFSSADELAIHLAWDGARLRAVAPLVRRKGGGVVRLQMLGCENYEPEAFLHDDAAALDMVCRSVAAEGKPIVLQRLGAGAEELTLLQAVHRGRGVKVVRASSTRTHFNFTGGRDWTSFLAEVSSGRRKELDRKRKALAKLGEISFEAVTPDAQSFGHLFEELVRVEATGWKAQNGTAIAQRPDARAFYSGFGRRMAEQGLLRLFFLRLDGRAVAAQYQLAYAGQLWELKIAYDEAFAKHSPGALLTHEVLRYCCEEGLSGIDHLGAAEDWQRRWPVEVREHTTLRLYPTSVAGALALALDTFDFARRRFAERAARPATQAAAEDGPAKPRFTPLRELRAAGGVAL